MKKYILYSIICLFALGELNAQDIHYSQFYASPMNLNPALSGNERDYRISGIYRNQWRAVSTPFQTYSAAADSRIPIKKLKKDVLGAGLVFTGDRAGDARLMMNSLYLSLAYHKRLTKDGNHFITLGLQPGFVQKSLKYQQLLFPSQHLGNDFDPNASQNENVSNPAITYFDMNAGLLIQNRLGKKISMMNGFTVYHLTFPKESFLGESVRLSPRYTVHGGLRIQLAEKWFVTPNYIFQFQNASREFIVGSGVEYHLKASGLKHLLVPSLGFWFRPGDAAVISTGIEYARMRIMAAYDVNVSNLSAASNNRGAFEIALIYTGLFSNPAAAGSPVLVPCPRM